MPPVTLGIRGYDSLHFVVEDIERSRRFYTEKFGFQRYWKSP